MYLYITISFATIVIILFLFIILLKNKIEALEVYIKNLFKIRTNIIPSIFEVSDNTLIRHDDIFREIIKLRKVSFAERSFERDLSQVIWTEQSIHNELNFIFRICNKHPKLLSNGKFIYLRALIISNSYSLWEYLKLYKKMLSKYNSYIKIKNYSVIWLLIPIEKKENI